MPDAELSRAVLRRRTVINMLILAAQMDPAASWERMTRLAAQFGAGLSPPVTAAEAAALGSMPVAQVFGNNGLSRHLLMDEALHAGEPPDA